MPQSLVRAALPPLLRSVVGGLLLALGMAAATASWCSLTAPMHCVSAAAACLHLELAPCCTSTTAAASAQLSAQLR